MLRNLNKLATVPILALPRPVKRLTVLLLDICLCALTVWLAFFLRLNEWVSLIGTTQLPDLPPFDAWKAALTAIFLAIPLFVGSGLYRAIFRYSGWPVLLTVARAVAIYSLIYATIFSAIGIEGVPRTIGFIQPLLLFLFVGLSRSLAHIWLGDQYQNFLKQSHRTKTLIYGAGSSGRQLAAALASSHEILVVGFLDDDDRLHGHLLNGLPIHNPDDLPNLVTTLDVRDVLLALPSLNRKRRNEILWQIQNAHVLVRTLPSVSDLALGRVRISDLRELDIDDLLGREVVAPNHILLAKNISNKVVLVTGAGGTIGSELCRQIISVAPAKLLLVDHSEFALYTIHHELQAKLAVNLPTEESDSVLIPLLASVQDQERMLEIINTWKPDTLYHAAAYKHVPLVEHNLVEGIKNNVFGTLSTAQAALENKVTDFVLVSTDKAIRPTNAMGASKRLAEMLLQALAAAGSENKTKFSMVRFGNVLDSSGSVVPRFRQQIRDGGPITLTHPDISRYFMSIPEAAQLVIQSGAMAKGGDVFVLDMGQPVKILDLAKRMVELSGLVLKNEENLDGDIAIEIVGLRPGEKLYEELLLGNSPQNSAHPKIMRARDDFIEWQNLQPKLTSLDLALNGNDVKVIRLILQQLVPDYTPSKDIVDWIFLEHEKT